MTDVIIVGAGHAGLAASACLQTHGIEHCVLERGQIGESWRNQRWDSFCMNTPNWTLNLPDKPYAGDDPDGFMTKDGFIDYLVGYADAQRLPVRANITVTHARYSEAQWHLQTSKEPIQSRVLLVATSTYQHPNIPESGNLASSIVTISAADYRHPDTLPPGRVMVIGSAQSGMQIVDDLLDAGREVLLSTGKAGRVPRRYRGRDLNYWYDKLGLMDRRAGDLDDPRRRWSGQPQISGWDGGHTVSLQKFHRKGVRLLGRYTYCDETVFHFGQDLRENIAAADRHSAEFCRSIDHYIEAGDLTFPSDAGDDPMHDPIDDLTTIPEPDRIDVTNEGISAVIWATGFRFDYSWVKANAFDKFGYPKTDRGEASAPGLFFLGMNYLHTRKSGIVYGITGDANHVAARIRSYLKAD